MTLALRSGDAPTNRELRAS